MTKFFRLRRRVWLPKIRAVGMLTLLTIFPALLSGCATSREAQQSAAPTVSGSVSVGMEKSF